jgi:hypothetical protein
VGCTLVVPLMSLLAARAHGCHRIIVLLTLIMDEFGLPVLLLRTLTHSNQRIYEELRGVVRAHAGAQPHSYKLFLCGGSSAALVCCS